MTILQDATSVLHALASHSEGPEDPEAGRHWLDGEAMQSLTGLKPAALSDAVDLLEENGYANVRRAIGTSPYSFLHAQATPRGRVEAERVSAERPTPGPEPPRKPTDTPVVLPVGPVVQRSPTPVGSPYGFTEQDWAAVAFDRSDGSRLIVCLGFQWQSHLYDGQLLERNVHRMFAEALSKAQAETKHGVRLDFRRLQGGYGAHLFNEIARVIIGSDIAVFDTSDLNPNVMIELGVALTWGTAALPIRAANSPRPPSDISGQTWAEYTDSGETWADEYHEQKLIKLVELALRRKRRV